MATLNKCFFIGRLTRDPETRNAGSSTVTNFGLAVDDSYKTKDDEWVNRAFFIECQAWNGMGKSIAEKRRKGDEVHIEGKLSISEKDDKKYYQFTVLNLQFLSAPGGKNKPVKEVEETEEDEPAPKKKSRPAKVEKKATPKPVESDEDSEDGEDDQDIPF